MPITKDQAQQLASLACAARPHGARRWDAPGVMAALGKVAHLHLADVALAVFRAADDKTINTPGVIANPRSACWHERATHRPELFAPNVIPAELRCSVCSKRREDCGRVRFADDDHTFTSAAVDQRRDPAVIAQIVQAAKAEVASTKPATDTTAEPHTPDPRAQAARQQLATTPVPDTRHEHQEHT